MLIAAAYRITPQRAWRSLRGRVEALEEIYRRQARRNTLLRFMPDFLGNLLIGYQVKQHLLKALEFAVRLSAEDNPLREALSGALRRARLARNKYPALHETARELDDPLLGDLFRLLEEAEEEGGNIAAILEAYLEHAYQRKATKLLEQAKVLPLQLLGITVPLLLPVMIIVMVAPFLYEALQLWVGK
jgi:hypothetical protein